MTRMILTAIPKDDRTHRIPNDNSNDPNMVEDVFLNELVDKIQLGKEEVTKKDIQQLASIMNSTTQKEVRTVRETIIFLFCCCSITLPT